MVEKKEIEKTVREVEKEEREKFQKEMIKIKYEQKLAKIKKGGIIQQWLNSR